MSSVEIDPMSSPNNNIEGKEPAPQTVEIFRVASMGDLAPSMKWTGTISAKGDQALNENEKARYKELLGQSIVPTPEKGQIGCMDGRTLLLGPKTAGGTIGNAIRIMLASHAYEGTPSLPFENALEIAVGVDEKYGNQSGSHDLGQCGAFAFAQHGVTTIAKNPEISREGTVNYFNAVDGEFSDTIQTDIEKAAVNILPSDGSSLLEPHVVAELIRKYNMNALPHLDSVHAEEAILVTLTPGTVLDSGAFAKAATDELGKVLNVFGYSWDYHMTIASELGGSLGEYYLQSVTSQDVPILGQLTDGSPDIFVYK